jgi:hypothetical protein
MIDGMKLVTMSALSVGICSVAALGGGSLTPLEPMAEFGSYAGQALDVDGNLAAVGHKVDGTYALRFYEHSQAGWLLSETASIGSRRAVSLAFGEGFIGAALGGSGIAGVVLEPGEDGWAVAAELINPDASRFNGFSLAAAGDDAIFIACNDSTQQYRDAVLVYERVKGTWQHVQTIAPSSAVCTLFGEDIDAAGDLLVIGATRVLSCSGGSQRGAHVYLRGETDWQHATTLQSGDTNGKWVACDRDNVVSWCSITGPNSTFDYLQAWHRSGESFQSYGSLSSGSWGYDIYFPEGMQIADGVLSFGTCSGFWGCQTNSTTNRTVYTAQRDGNYWRMGNAVTVPSGYASSGFGRTTQMGGGSLLIGAPAYGGSRGVVFAMPLGDALPCPADLNGDGNVDVNDLIDIIDQWGSSGRADLNGDSVVNAEDLLRVLAMWGEC